MIGNNMKIMTVIQIIIEPRLVVALISYMFFCGEIQIIKLIRSKIIDYKKMKTKHTNKKPVSFSGLP